MGGRSELDLERELNCLEPAKSLYQHTLGGLRQREISRWVRPLSSILQWHQESSLDSDILHYLPHRFFLFPTYPTPTGLKRTNLFFGSYSTQILEYSLYATRWPRRLEIFCRQQKPFVPSTCSQRGANDKHPPRRGPGAGVAFTEAGNPRLSKHHSLSYLSAPLKASPFPDHPPNGIRTP